MSDLQVSYPELDAARIGADAAIASYIAGVSVPTMMFRMQLSSADALGSEPVQAAARGAASALSAMGSALIDALVALSSSIGLVTATWRDADAALARTATP